MNVGEAAFVLLKEGDELTEEALLAAIRDRIVHFKLPKKSSSSRISPAIPWAGS